METNYDEDLNENVFFQVLQVENSELFIKAISEGCVICVPRSGSLQKYALTVDDFYSHILIPSEELPETHFRTLKGREVKISNRIINIEQDDIAPPVSVHILFEETFYNDDFLKYKVLCLEHPLEQQSTAFYNNTGLVNLRNLTDCIDLLMVESSHKNILEHLDGVINGYLETLKHTECKTLQHLKDVTSSLYAKCLQLLLKDTRIQTKSLDKHCMDNFKIAVETYLHHRIYNCIIKLISSFTLYEDACLNKIIRNLSDFQTRDLEIRHDLVETIPKAKLELSKIDGFSTILGKLGCLKRTMNALSKHPTGSSVLCADDLLPIMVFLIIKTNIPNWNAHLIFLKEFKFSTNCSYTNESSFLITCLEASVEYIKSKTLLGSADPEGQELTDDTFEMTKFKLSKTDETNTLSEFFKQIRLENLEKITDILNKPKTFDFSMVTLNLCHPLCTCDKCEVSLSLKLCETNPTVHSCDDKGLTALHVAAMFGAPRVVDLLLPLGADPNVADCSGALPIHYAAAKGHQNVLLFLAHSGSEINTFDNDLNTPLHFCVNNGHEGCVKALIYFSEHLGVKLNVNPQNSYGDTPLHHAARWGYISIVRILIENGANPFLQNKRKLLPVDLSTSINISNLLTNVECRDRKDENTDVYFLRIRDSNSVANTSRQSYDFSDQDETETVNKKIEQGIRPNSTDCIKQVEKLFKAVTFGDLNLTCYYLGLKVNAVKKNKPTLQQDNFIDVQSRCHPLCSCEVCSHQSRSLSFETHCKFELDVNICNLEGFTPLHISSMYGKSELAKLLIENGALLNARTNIRLLTPLMLACEHERLHVAKMLLANGCNIDLQDVVGNTALHFAARTNNFKLVELLLKFEPNLKLKNNNNRTVLKEAEERMSLGLVKLLKGGEPVDLNLF